MATKKKIPKKKSAAEVRRGKLRKAFLDGLMEHNKVGATCESIGISISTPYQWAEQSLEFAKAWEKAKIVVASNLEDEAIKRGFNGSDTLLIFMLKALAPERHRERYDVKAKAEVTTVKAEDLTDDQLAAIVKSGMK
jgi:hypothetical protein